jgi:hypothetical protein
MKYSVKFQCDNGGFSIGRYSGFLGVSEKMLLAQPRSPARRVHAWGLAEAKVSAPAEKVWREILDHLR